MTRYARDEFDRVPQHSSRQGVHRAGTDTPRPSLWPILLVGVGALAIGLVCFLVLPKLGIAQAGSGASISAQDPKGGTVPSGQATASQQATPSASATTQAAEASAQPSETPTPTLSSAVDKTAVVSVYNGTSTGGLAARVAAQVQGGGWPLGIVGNWGGAPQTTSAIFYRGAAQKGNAEALSQLLGITKLVDSAEFQQPVVVLVGPGFK
jgi:LytR cell envelope-related transcriptional attenuator